jgi:hypothetical protein
MIKNQIETRMEKENGKRERYRRWNKMKKEDRGEEKVEKEKKTSKQENITSSPLLIRKLHSTEYECFQMVRV